MELRIEIRGVEEHISLIEEELREIRKCEDCFRGYESANFIDSMKTEEMRERIQRLKKSVEARRQFLENLPGEYRKLEEQLEEGITKLVVKRRSYLEE